MKKKAIVSLLWGTQFDVLREFLAMHDPMVVLARTGTVSNDMERAIAATGSSLVFLDSLVDSTVALPLIASESAELLALFDVHLSRLQSTNATTKNNLDKSSKVIGEIFAANLPFTLWLLESLTSAAKNFDIELLITNEDVTAYGKVATAWAKAHSIASLHLSHSIALIDPYTVHNEIMADKLAVFGRRGMEGYLDLGFPEERMVITGNPAWDIYSELRKYKPDCRRYLNEKYSFHDELPLVVFGTTYSANLSSNCNEEIFKDTLIAFLAACEMLWKNNLHFNAVIKDHPSNHIFGQKCYDEICLEMNLSNKNIMYCRDDGREFSAAANVLVGVDSNYLVEGMLARTPVINIMNISGLLMGPCFEAETGIFEVEWHELPDTIKMLLTDSNLCQAVIEMGQRRSSHYNYNDGDALAALRVANVMLEMIKNLPSHTVI